MKTANPHHKDQPLIFQQSNFSMIELKKTKLDQVFKALLNGWEGNRFDAERELHDHTLPCTVFAIEKKYGATIQRESETVPSFNNSVTHVSKYWIADEDRDYFLRRISQ